MIIFLKPFKSIFSLSIFDKYLLNQFTGPFLFSVAGFAIIAIVDILMYLVELAVIQNVAIFTVIRLLIYKLPALMILFFPMAVLFTVMLTLVRMIKDNEVTVLRASGIHLFRLSFPLIFACVTIVLISYLTNEKVVPWTNKVSDNLIRQEIHKRPPPSIKENVVFKGMGNRFFYVKRVNYDKAMMSNILVFESKSKFPRITVAEEARWTDKTWDLLNGYIYEIDKEGQIGFISKFDTMKLYVYQNLRNFYSSNQSPKEMDSKTLKEKIIDLDKGGVNTRNLKIELSMKKSMPVACLVFGILGIALCFSGIQSGKDWWGVIIAIIIAVLSTGFYFFLVAYCKALAKSGALSPFYGAWLPNIVYGSIGSLLILYQSKTR